MRIAVIGAGIAGITASFLLQKQHEVTLFEADDRIGGHANPVLIKNGDEDPFCVDTGFTIFNPHSYPMFLKLMREFGLLDFSESAPMSFSFQDIAHSTLLPVNAGFRAFLGNPRLLFQPRFYWLWIDLLRFRRQAFRDFEAKAFGQATLAEYLAQGGYSSFFIRGFIYPMAMSVWSIPIDRILEFPAETFVGFLMNHQYLQGWVPGRWSIMKGSSQIYLSAFKELFRGKIRLSSPVRKVSRSSTGVLLTRMAGEEEPFDQVIFALHADQTLPILDDPSALERELLEKWKYHSSPASLHVDSSVLPGNRRDWTSWNVQFDSENPGYPSARVTYFINRVQNLKSRRDYFLTLGPAKIDPIHVIKRFEYTHPIFDFAALRTQARLPELNGQHRSFFCGSYFGFGFHEDAIRSAVKVAEQFGISYAS